MQPTTPVLGTEARDRALVLDFLIEHEALPKDLQFAHFARHAAWHLSARDVRLAVEALIADDLVCRDGDGSRFTVLPAGLAAHRATQPADAQG